MNRTMAIGVGLCALLAFAAGCCVLMVAAGGLLYFQTTRVTGPITGPGFTVPPTPAPRRPTLTPAPQHPSATEIPAATPTPASSEMLAVLAQADPAVNDLRTAALRLKGLADIPVTVSAQPADHPLGTVLEFNVSNQDTNATTVVKARLIYKTTNTYFFAEQGVSVDEAAVRTMMDRFQNKTYPTDREFFGSEWSPGIDGDPRLYVLYTRGLGGSILGYFSEADEYSHLASPNSNEKEMFYVNADNTRPGDQQLDETLAHEFEHMIQFHEPVRGDLWMNEGPAMLAELLNGYQPRGHASSFTSDPDVQLNAWSENGSDTIPHYGAAFMFFAYFLDRFGEDATRSLIAEPAGGLHAVDAVLAKRGLTDPATGQPLTAEGVFADWAVANLVNDPQTGNGRFAYRRFTPVPTVEPVNAVDVCPAPEQSDTVHQFGTDYYQITCTGTYQLKFSGAPGVAVVPTDPHSGQYAFWSNRGDGEDNTLTHAFDLSGLTTAQLSYWAWWDIEDGYDYTYLEVSTDNGQNWKTIRASSTTASDPTGSNFGTGYTGQSSDWVHETADLSAYAGQKILVRFEYLTDGAVVMNGFLLDDITLPQLNYQSDFENGDGGWAAQGFVRLRNVLPQRFIVQVIHQDNGAVTVDQVPLDASDQGQAAVTIAPGETVTLAISGATRYTTQTASYSFALDR